MLKIPIKSALAFLFSLLLCLLGLLISAGAMDFGKLRLGPKKKYSGRTPTAVVAVRGLDEPGTEGDIDARNEEAVAWLESLAVSREDVDAFMADSGLEALP